MRILMIGLMVFTLVTAVALSQVSTGTINVEVQDSTGAVVPGATVDLKHVSTSQARQGKTNDSGQFRAAFLPVGEYTVSAEAAGFKRKTITGLVLRVDQNTTITAVLVPGEIREIVEVAGTAPLLEANTSSVGQVIDTRQIQDMPLSGRNPFALGLLSGNTVPMTGQSTNLPFVGGGGRFTSTEVMLDGVDNNAAASGGAIGRSGVAYTPSVDAVQEFKVQTNNFSAEFGQAAGVVMNATIRAGTNAFHGTVFEFLRNDKLDATNFFTNAVGSKKGMYRQNQFGGALGGRIIRNRTFFFGDYQGTRRSTQSGSAISDLAPAAYRTGDFSLYSATIYDPAARRIGPTGVVISTPYVGNRIPASQVNPTSAAIIGLIPMPNYGAANAQSRNFFIALPRRNRDDRGDVRIDHTISSSNSLYGRFSMANSPNVSVGSFGAGNWIGGGSTSLDNSRQMALSDVHVFSPTTVNEFRFGYVRSNSSSKGTAPQGVAFAQQNKMALFPFPELGFPSFNFYYAGESQGAQQFSGFGGSTSAYSVENRFQWVDNLNITRGGHTLKFGTDLRRLRYETLRGGYGNIRFGSMFTSSSDKAGSGAPLADFLLGFPHSFGEAGQMLDWGRERQFYAFGYFQDDWKATRKLTLNLGIRYDLFTQPVDAKDRGSLFDVDRGVFQVPGQGGYSRAVVDGDHNNLAPRAGFAYQPGRNLVIRGGYGMFYGFRERNPETTNFSQNPPNLPMFAKPPVTAAGTVTPPYTINTPIVALSADPLLKAFTAAVPYQRTFRATAFHKADMPVQHQFNVSVQYEPLANWLFAVTLSGARGKNLTSGVFMKNSIPFEQALAGRTAQTDRPFPNVNGAIYYSGSMGSNNYHAASFKVEKRFSMGLTFLANYTISKNIENMGFITNFSQFATVIMLDSYHPEREKGVSPLDIPQVFVVSYIYALPWGPGRPWLTNGLASKILGGWNLSGITSVRGGFPAEVRTNVNPPVYGSWNLPDRVSGESMYLGKGPDGYLNPAAFRVPGTVLNQRGASVQLFGNSGRATIRGPGSVNLDFAVLKDFSLTERSKIQFRSEFFNLTNTPTFNLATPSATSMTCRGTPNGPCTGNADFGTMSSASATGRQIQFGLKFIF
ncbi:MAG: TonB-dependent receptor [Bryobacterales bacterium]|nr:TonB-dependent receptor [Bryobacterales bacterium]